mgnify:CR=1 FL=1
MLTGGDAVLTPIREATPRRDRTKNPGEPCKFGRGAEIQNDSEPLRIRARELFGMASGADSMMAKRKTPLAAGFRRNDEDSMNPI